MEKFLRWLRILYAIQARPGITVKELAEKCEVRERTIYRDLEQLYVIAPIINEGHGKGYRFRGQFYITPLNWTEQEALAFSMLPSLIDESKMPPGFRTAYDKVMATYVRERKERAMNILERISEIIQMGTPAYREEGPNFLAEMIQAILESRTIHTVYHTQSRDELTVRDIDPYVLVPREQRFYVIGYCHKAGEVRTFRLSRFRDVQLTDRTFDKGSFNLRQYLKNTWSIERGNDVIHFKVRFSRDVARYIKEEEMFVRPRMTDLPDGGMLFEVTLNRDREFLNWVMQYGPSAEILQPVKYRRLMRRRLKQWLAMYEDADDGDDGSS